MPEMHYVGSSNIEAIGYEPDRQELYVRFLKTGDYVYYYVEEWVFNEFMQANSKGGYLHNYIKGRYDYARL